MLPRRACRLQRLVRGPARQRIVVPLGVPLALDSPRLAKSASYRSSPLWRIARPLNRQTTATCCPQPTAATDTCSEQYRNPCRRRRDQPRSRHRRQGALVRQLGAVSVSHPESEDCPRSLPRDQRLHAHGGCRRRRRAQSERHRLLRLAPQCSGRLVACRQHRPYRPVPSGKRAVSPRLCSAQRGHRSFHYPRESRDS
jgi:hypothetical protein